MDKYLKRKLWLGISVTSAMLFFLIGIFFIGRKEEMYVPTLHVNAVFANVNGLREGDFVRYAGVKVGLVEQINFINDSTIDVTMKIEKKMQPYIMNDDLAYIATEGLVGNKLLNIVARKKSRVAVKDGDILETIEPFDTQQIIATLLNTNDNAAVITGNLAAITKKMNEGKGIFSSVISDTAAKNDMKAILANLKITSEKMTVLSGNFEKLSQNLDINGGIAGSLFNDTALVNELNDAILNLKNSSNNVNAISEKINASTQPGTSSTLSVLMSDTAFAKDLRESVTNLKSSTAKLDENMEALQHSVIFRRYFRKKNAK